jgi:hypothetical protein
MHKVSENKRKARFDFTQIMPLFTLAGNSGLSVTGNINFFYYCYGKRGPL